MLHHLLKKYVSWLLIFQFLLLHTGWAQNWSVFMKFVTPELLPVVHHELNSLIYFGVIVYRSCKHLKTVLFWPTLCFLYVIVNYCLFNSVLHPWYRLYDFRGCRTVAWNSLPSQLRQSVGCGQFRWQLKTFPYGIKWPRRIVTVCLFAPLKYSYLLTVVYTWWFIISVPFSIRRHNLTNVLFVCTIITRQLLQPSLLTSVWRQSVVSVTA